MNNEKREYRVDDLNKESKKFISMTLNVCEMELAKHNDDIPGLSSAAMAVRESITTFLALVNKQK